MNQHAAAVAEASDSTIARIAEYAVGLDFDDLPAAVVHDCKRRVIDTVGCGLGAFHEEPSRIARALAGRARCADAGAPVLGTDHRTLPELAAFANGVMMRYLDGNDTYPGGGGHPSDTLSAVLAVATSGRGDGRTLITALVLAYEIYHALFKSACMRDRGMDHVFYTCVAGAAGACKMLGLDRRKTEHALALAVTPNLPLEVTRRGKLSMWKGCAAGNASRNGVFAALLAAAGMTGPERAVEGAHGLFELIGPFRLPPLTAGGDRYRITEANLKYFLSEYHSQAPIAAALELRATVQPDEIEAVTVYTYWFAWSEIGNEPEKWRPTTRETADHSLPFIIAAVLLDGGFSDRIFAPERLTDARVHAIADRITVEEDPELTQRFPEYISTRIELTTKDGTVHTARMDYPRGHHRNPMTDGEVAAKFGAIAGRAITGQQAAQALDFMWALEDAPDAARIFELTLVKDAA